MLDNALDYGIKECDFWNMTFAELERECASKRRMMRFQERERATYDYILASLIGRAVSSTMSSNVKYPDIHEVYPHIFTENKQKEIEKQEQIDMLSALRFKQFAHSYNKKFKGVQDDK